MTGFLSIVFLALAFFLQRAPGTTVDLAVTTGLQQVDNPVVVLSMVAISALGFWPWSWLTVVVAVAGFALAGFRREALFLLLTPGASLLSGLAKLVVERPRPTGDDIRVMSQLLDFSYPSGHVVSYVSFYGFLYFLVYVLFKHSWRRTATLVLLGALVLLIGVSRIYLGQHWVSDVLGGYALGTAYLLALIELYRATSTRTTSRSSDR